MAGSRPASADCFVRLGVELIAHRWDAVVLTALRIGPLRRVDLRAEIGGITDKSLHQSLLRLRDNGLVDNDGPERRYRLTDTGHSLAHGPVLTLARWAEENQTSLTR